MEKQARHNPDIQGERACISMSLPFLQYEKLQNKGKSLAMHASAIRRPYQCTLPWNTQERPTNDTCMNETTPESCIGNTINFEYTEMTKDYHDQKGIVM